MLHLFVSIFPKWRNALGFLLSNVAMETIVEREGQRDAGVRKNGRLKKKVKSAN